MSDSRTTSPLFFKMTQYSIILNSLATHVSTQEQLMQKCSLGLSIIIRDFHCRIYQPSRFCLQLKIYYCHIHDAQLQASYIKASYKDKMQCLTIYWVSFFISELLRNGSGVMVFHAFKLASYKQLSSYRVISYLEFLKQSFTPEL